MNKSVPVVDTKRRCKNKSEYEDYVGLDMSAEWTPPDHYTVFCGGNDPSSGKCSGRHQRKRMKQVEPDVKTLRCSTVKAEIITANRQEWRRVVQAILALVAPSAALRGRITPDAS
ncbi:hypothetical protein Y032_0089g2223 [Ancylostoma ceylanicum]|uniref:Uncharacterized protein n=1 Tax=Ancylostoma ceylanicum TaxID=53326 RepID=A0A016TN46_9BILA|nr:hypothetical protein Y032_0089g2223 [Ancylostoma ceylanicum]